jgi:hypothetical protein
MQRNACWRTAADMLSRQGQIRGKAAAAGVSLDELQAGLWLTMYLSSFIHVSGMQPTQDGTAHPVTKTGSQHIHVGAPFDKGALNMIPSGAH